jgi:hypothetical protein
MVCLRCTTFLAKSSFDNYGTAYCLEQYFLGLGKVGALNWEDSGQLWEWFRFGEVVKEEKK